MTMVDVSQPTPARLGGTFARLWTATTASALGLGLSAVATPLFVASTTSNPLAVSAATAASMAPWLIFGLPAGVIVDRLDRKRLMVMVDWARALVLAVLGATILTGHVNLVVLYIALIVVATGEVLMRTASSTLLPAIVPKAGLERANGWLTGGVMLAGSMVSGPLGGYLFSVDGSLPFLGNAVALVASALLVMSISGTFRAEAAPAPSATVNDAPLMPSGAALDTPPMVAASVSLDSAADEKDAPAQSPANQPPPSIRRDVIVGLRWLMKQRLLRTMALLIGLLNVTLTAALSILVLLARERLHLGSVGYGALFTALAVGGLLGSLIGDRLIKLVTATWTIRIGLILEALFHLVLATSTSGYAVAVAFLVFGLHSTMWSVVSTSLRQRLTPDAMLGRVSSAYLFVAAGGNCVGALLGGALATGFGLTAPYWVGFIVAAVVAALTWPVFNRRDVAAAYRS